MRWPLAAHPLQPGCRKTAGRAARGHVKAAHSDRLARLARAINKCTQSTRIIRYAPRRPSSSRTRPQEGCLHAGEGVLITSRRYAVVGCLVAPTPYHRQVYRQTDAWFSCGSCQRVRIRVQRRGGIPYTCLLGARVHRDSWNQAAASARYAACSRRRQDHARAAGGAAVDLSAIPSRKEVCSGLNAELISHGRLRQHGICKSPLPH